MRKNVRRFPFADRSTRSGTSAPLKRIVSVPSWPSILSLPSPGSQTKVSSPAPSSARSLPPLPSIESFPSPPSSSLVAFAAGDRVVAVSTGDCRRDAVGKGPLLSSMRTWIGAGRGVDGDRRDALARKAEVGRAVVTDIDLENAGLRPDCRRSCDLVARFGAHDRQLAVLELRVLELIRSCVRPTSGTADAAFPCPATIPAAPNEGGEHDRCRDTDNHTGRAVRDCLSRMRFFMVFLSEWLTSHALKTPATAAYSRAVGHALTRRRWVPWSPRPTRDRRPAAGPPVLAGSGQIVRLRRGNRFGTEAGSFEREVFCAVHAVSPSACSGSLRSARRTRELACPREAPYSPIAGLPEGAARRHSPLEVTFRCVCR